jgi:hypothetical protein
MQNSDRTDMINDCRVTPQAFVREITVDRDGKPDDKSRRQAAQVGRHADFRG